LQRKRGTSSSPKVPHIVENSFLFDFVGNRTPGNEGFRIADNKFVFSVRRRKCRGPQRDLPGQQGQHPIRGPLISALTPSANTPETSAELPQDPNALRTVWGPIRRPQGDPRTPWVPDVAREGLQRPPKRGGKF